MKRTPLFLAGFLLALVGASACSAILGYDQGTLVLDAGSAAGDGAPTPDGPIPPSGDGSPGLNDGSPPPSDAQVTDGPVAHGDSGADAGTRDSGTSDGSIEMEASVTCTGCPDATTVLYVAPASAGELRGIAVDNSKLYFAIAPDGGGGTIASCLKAGCAAPNPLAKDGTQVDNPEGVAVDPAGAAQQVYWANNSIAVTNAFSCGLPACTSPLSGVSGAAFGVAADSSLNDVYLGTSGGQLKQCSTANNSCTSPNTTLTNPVYGIAADSNNVFWGSGSFIYTAPSASITSAMSFFNDVGRAVYGMSLSSSGPSRLFWLSRLGVNGEVRTCPTGSCSSPQTFATGLASPWGLATDATYAYVTVNSTTGNGILRFPHP